MGCVGEPAVTQRLFEKDARYWFSQSVLNHRQGLARWHGIEPEHKEMALQLQRERQKARRDRKRAEAPPPPAPEGAPPYLPKKPS